MGKEIVAAPILKWAGSKLRLIEQIKPHLPVSPRKFYVEPFVGGAALLFWMLNNRSEYYEQFIVNDHNQDLIGMYETVKDNVEPLIKQLEELTQGIRAAKDAYEYYLARRVEYNSEACTDKLERAALLIFLNRMCFNGLYRVNREGKFNVPFGKRPDAVIYVPEVLRKDSEALKCVTFMHGDYSNAMVSEMDQDKAFYYFDPPYRPLNPTSNFNRYTKDVFGEYEQIALARHCRMLDEQGAFVMISNSDTSVANPDDDFYRREFPVPQFHHYKVLAPRLVNSNPFKRGPVPEVLITNYVPEPLRSRKQSRK